MFGAELICPAFGFGRFGLFSLTFMYFRSMTLLQREKESWGGKGDAVGGQVASRVTGERKRMILEQRNTENRAGMLEKAMAKAKAGEERRYAVHDLNS